MDLAYALDLATGAATGATRFTTQLAHTLIEKTKEFGGFQLDTPVDIEKELDSSVKI